MESTAGDVLKPGRYQLQNPLSLDPTVVETTAGLDPAPPGIFDSEFFFEEGDLCQGLSNVGLEPMSRVATCYGSALDYGHGIESN